MFSLICVWIKVWINNREAGDLRRHRCHYDVIVMKDCQNLMKWHAYVLSYKFCTRWFVTLIFCCGYIIVINTLMLVIQCQTIGKNIYRSDVQVTLYCHFKCLSLLSQIKFHGSSGHSKCNCLQDQANFHRSRAWKIVLIFNNDHPPFVPVISVYFPFDIEINYWLTIRNGFLVARVFR